MMLSATDNFYMQQEELVKECLLALKKIILSQDKDISPSWKYGMPFFCYRGKMFCYLWVHKKHHQPYLGLVEGRKFDHPALLSEKRSRMKIMLFDPQKDLPVKTITMILRQALDVYNTGEMKLKT